MIFQKSSSIDGRCIAWALAGSLIFHLLVFWPTNVPREKFQALPALVAHLQPGSTETLGSAARPLESHDVLPPSLRREWLAPKEKKLGKFPIEIDTALSAHAAGAATVAPSSAEEIIAQSVVRADTAVAVSAPSLQPSEGIDANGLRKFRIDLAIQARRSKNYPPQALASGWHGRADVQLTVDRGGFVGEPELLRSSGFAVLDAAAIDMLARAAQQTSIPDSLRGHTFSVMLPVVFDALGD
jgi:protein TonB